MVEIPIILDRACIILSMSQKFLVTRDGCEVLKRKNSQILKEDQFIKVALKTHCLEIELW